MAKVRNEEPTAGIARAASTGPLVLRIVGSDHVRSHPLPPTGMVVIGRGEQADVSIADSSVSRRHAILHVGPILRIEDAGSKHGLGIRGRRFGTGEAAVVAIGEPIELGAVVVMVQRAEKRPAAESGPLVADPAMQKLHTVIDRIAKGTISVLILGETGVGKEVTAQLIHRRSKRAGKPFVSVNCGALTESLLESELFGYERGAFTGAVQTKQGLLESAAGGTVFLDEVGELPPTVQVKLLRVLEDRRVTRLGSVKPVAIDVRFIAATNRDIEAEVAVGRFREDLFFRLNGAALTIPPLRDRPSEIEPLAREFTARFSEESGHAPLPLSPEVLAVLQRYDWPGNIRELRNIIERAVLLSAGEPIDLEHLPMEKLDASERTERRAADPVDTMTTGYPAIDSLTDEQRAERTRIVDALNACAGNQSRAAKMLGISRRVLVSRIGTYGIPRPRA